ncbi:MAG TPA: hypothetical protein VGF38_07285 [Ktedonobacterales bacterium]
MRNRAGSQLAALGRAGVKRWLGGGAALGMLLLTLALSGCGPFGGSDGATASGAKSLASLSWCDRPLITFQDDSTTAQKQITNWDDVKDQLGFTAYLPESMPEGTCLALAGGSIHNPIYGGQFSITYVLPKIGPVSFSEAPLHQGMSSKTQCIQSAQDSKTMICVGAISNTSITIASRQPEADIQAMFGTLKSNVAWVPGGTSSGSSKPTPTTAPTTAPAATATATATK